MPGTGPESVFAFVSGMPNSEWNDGYWARRRQRHTRDAGERRSDLVVDAETITRVSPRARVNSGGSSVITVWPEKTIGICAPMRIWSSQTPFGVPSN